MMPLRQKMMEKQLFQVIQISPHIAQIHREVQCIDR